MSADTKFEHNLFQTPELRRYVRTDITPPLDVERLILNALTGTERAGLKTPTIGDHSLMVTYKGHPGAVTSFTLQEGSLDIAQLQGAQGRKGLRVCTGLKWVQMFADQLEHLGRNSLAAQRITLPVFHEIEGLTGATAYENALGRYAAFVSRLQMRFSDQERRFILDLH